jgi:hypothetical protein
MEQNMVEPNDDNISGRIVEFRQFQDGQDRQVLMLAPVNFDEPPTFIGVANFAHKSVPGAACQTRFRMPGITTIQAAYDNFDRLRTQAYGEWKAEMDTPRIIGRDGRQL